MASRCGQIFHRSSISALKSAISKPNASLRNTSAMKSSTRPSLDKAASSPLRRFSLSRSPSELGGVASMLPLHSAVAAARMTSCLSSSSRSSRALSQVVFEALIPRFDVDCELLSGLNFIARFISSQVTWLDDLLSSYEGRLLPILYSRIRSALEFPKQPN